MANSLITRCPKCSTAFRVSDEVLSMAKGKVRCGQCFHIFDASKQPAQNDQTEAAFSDKNRTQKQASPASTQPKKPQEKASNPTSTRPVPEGGVDDPDSMQNLFNNKDLNPLSETNVVDRTAPKKAKPQASDSDDSQATKNDLNAYQERAKSYQERARSAQIKINSNDDTQADLAPWEVELAQVEAALNARPTSKNIPTPVERTIEKVAEQKAAKANQPAPSKSIQPNNKPKAETESIPEEDPDYMVALQSLAQTASEQKRPSEMENQHSILEQLSAQESLAPLLEEHEASDKQKNTHPWLWFLGVLLGLALLASQVAVHFFDEGSRSTNFRSVYRAICSYYNCVLPKFEDVSTITIQHVRIQSHPSIKNTLLVNAIITNVSGFSQSMPKIALEFFDLNGSPVAARLFSPTDYLHKDFLDITYMPPNTPIHVVIPIQDPGARAVTHLLKAFPSDTRSY